MDDLIQLYHEGQKGYPPPLDVHRVVYKSFSEVMGLLNSEGIEDAEPEQEIEEPDASSTSVESITVTALPEANLPPSEEQINATCVIQTAYRKLLRRRCKSTMSTLEATRASFFNACQEESLKMEWPNGIYYRLLFLGPLLVCLSAAYSWAIDTKVRNKERLKLASHKELNDVAKHLTAHTYGLALILSGCRHSQYLFRKIIKDLQRLQEAPGPQSELHRKREVETLKSLVLEVESLLANIALAHTVAQDVKDDMAMAIIGIVAVRKPPKPKQNLTTEIEDGVGDLYDEFEHSTEEGDDINSEVDVNTAAEGVRIGYSAEDEDDRKEDGGEDDFSRWMKMKKMLAM